MKIEKFLRSTYNFCGAFLISCYFKRMVIGLNNSKNKAFNIIELLVVVAMVSVGLTIAYTSFISYIVRGKVTGAVRILDSYQQVAVGLRARYGTINPYYVLFSDSNTVGWVSGTTSSGSAVKEVNLKYVNTISADSGVNAGNRYILIGAGLQNDGVITDGADHIYIMGIETSSGSFIWKCGSSASKGDTVTADYLPQGCQDTLP